MSTPTRLRDRGMALVEDASEPDVIAAIDQVIAAYNDSGRPWSANDIRALLPEHRRPLLGARVRAAATRRPVEMVRISYVPSDLPSTHAHPVALWIGADHVEQASA
jgi:hypothetical protein